MLDLSLNPLTDFPAQICNLFNLDDLSLWQCGIYSLPAEIGRLSELTILWLEDNYLEKLPREIGNLTNLKELRLCPIVVIEYLEVISGQTLNVSFNRLTALPREITQRNNLTQLNLFANRLPIPKEILKNYEDPVGLLRYYFNRQR